MKVDQFKKQEKALAQYVMKESFGLTEKLLPETKDWKVGKEYEVSLKVRMVSQREEEGKMYARFEILKVKAL